MEKGNYIVKMVSLLQGESVDLMLKAMWQLIFHFPAISNLLETCSEKEENDLNTAVEKIKSGFHLHIRTRLETRTRQE